MVTMLSTLLLLWPLCRVVLRNHIAQKAIEVAEQEDYSEVRLMHASHYTVTSVESTCIQCHATDPTTVLTLLLLHCLTESAIM